MQKEYLTKSPKQTQELGKIFAKMLLKSRFKSKAVVIGLKGDLGGGKTTFLQGFAKGLGLKGKILSPTFIIVRRTGCFYHIDAYRLKEPKELLSLGFKKIIAGSNNIVAVEWADRVKKIMPCYAVWVDFYFIDKNKRKIVIRLSNGKEKKIGRF